MRLLEYKQELFGHGYTVIGADMHYESLPSPKCKPIRMTNMYRGKPREDLVEYLIESVVVDWDEDETGFFYTNYADIMRGKYTEWQIISFRVVVGHICLDYYNYQTKEYGWFSLSDEVNPCGINVSFEVPSQDGRPATRYLVSLFGLRTTVTEYGDHIRRDINFFFVNPDKTDPFVDAQYVEIAEYADL